MILKFLKQLFCFPHHYEQELSPFDEEWWEDCRKCEKTRKVKKVIIQELGMVVEMKGKHKIAYMKCCQAFAECSDDE